MNDLRTALERVADTVEPLPVADDLWQRGRAARRRSRLTTVAAVLVLLASVTGAVWLLGDGDPEARTASSPAEAPYPGMLPRRIEDPGAGQAEAGLAVGRASAAFVSDDTGLPVVIGARDGVPHRLELPGWAPDGQGLALTPDGLRLAWQDRGTDVATVAVLELMTGEVTTVEVDTDGDLRLRELSWSPSSVWLAWIGDTDGGARVGRLRPWTSSLEEDWFVAGNVPDVAVSNDARLVVSRAGGGLFWLQGDAAAEKVSDADGLGAGRFSPDGAHVSLRSGPGDASSTLRWSDQAVLEHSFPAGTLGDAAVLPQGWLDDRTQLLLAQGVDGGGGELVVTTPEVSDTSTWRGSVGSVDPSVAPTLSLAVDLVPDLDGTSSQELTHDFGDVSGADGPLRPYGIELSLFIGLGVAAAIAVLLALRWWWRRVRTPAARR